jgi:uncharacterized phage protein (TIGR01671 family)
MKREFLFRGKRIDSGEWVYGGISVFKGCVDIFDQNAIDNSCEQVFDYTVGQFTGLTDKNGVKIFEGDIVKYSNDSPGEVVFENQQFLATIHGSKSRTHLHIMGGVNKWEVTGNIHDVKE